MFDFWNGTYLRRTTYDAYARFIRIDLLRRVISYTRFFHPFRVPVQFVLDDGDALLQYHQGQLATLFFFFFSPPPSRFFSHPECVIATRVNRRYNDGADTWKHYFSLFRFNVLPFFLSFLFLFLFFFSLNQRVQFDDERNTIIFIIFITIIAIK